MHRSEPLTLTSPIAHVHQTPRRFAHVLEGHAMGSGKQSNKIKTPYRTVHLKLEISKIQTRSWQGFGKTFPQVKGYILLVFEISS